MMILTLQFFVFTCIYLLFNKKKELLSLSIIQSSVVMYAMIVACIYLLHFLQAINTQNLLLCWSTISIFFLSLMIKLNLWQNFSNIEFPFSIKEKFFLGLTLIPLLIIAIVSAPNNHDSMTYHLPRVMFWVQNHNLNFYPTTTVNQLSQPWGHELVLLNFFLALKNDYLFNFVQYLSLLGVLLSMWILLGIFEISHSIKKLGIFLTLSIPMILLESVTTQNDLFFSFWVIVLITFIYYQQKNKLEYKIDYLIALTLSFILLAKGTGPLFSFPWMVYWCWKKSILRITKVVLISGLLLIPFWIQQIKGFSNILGSAGATSHAQVDYPTLSKSIVIMVKSIGIHFATPWETLNQKIVYVLSKSLNLINLNINQNGSSFFNYPYELTRLMSHEDTVTNFLHTIFIFICFFLFLKNIKKMDYQFIIYFLCLSFSFIGFHSLIRWQPWIQRLQLSFFIMSIPIICIVLNKKNISNTLIYFLLFIFMLGSLPFVWGQKPRPLAKKMNIFTMPRVEQYFLNEKHLQGHYEKIAKEILQSQCKYVEIKMKGGSYQYPLWPLIHWDSKYFFFENNQSEEFKNIHWPNKMDACLVVNLDNND